MVTASADIVLEDLSSSAFYLPSIRYIIFIKIKNFFPNVPPYLRENLSASHGIALVSTLGVPPFSQGLLLAFQLEGAKVNPRHLDLLMTKVLLFAALLLDYKVLGT